MNSDYLIIAVVSVIAIAAHIAIFHWVRFKIDEGVICKYLEDQNATDTQRTIALPVITTASEIAEERCLSVCSRSSRIRLKEDASGAWLADSRRL